MTTALIDCTETLTARPPTVLSALPPDAEVDHEWLEFLALGLQLESASLVGQAPWRHPPVLLSY